MTLINKIQEAKQYNIENAKCPINILPAEIVLHVLSFLKKSEVYKAATTDSRWRNIVELRLKRDSTQYCYDIVYTGIFHPLSDKIKKTEQTFPLFLELETMSLNPIRRLRNQPVLSIPCLGKWADKFVKLMGPFHTDLIQTTGESFMRRVRGTYNLPPLEQLNQNFGSSNYHSLRTLHFSSTQQTVMQELVDRVISNCQEQKRLGNNQQQLNNQRCELIAKIIEETGDVQQSMLLPIWVAGSDVSELGQQKFITLQEMCDLGEQMSAPLSLEKQITAYTQLTVLISQELQKMRIDPSRVEISEENFQDKNAEQLKMWRENAMVSLSFLTIDECTTLHSSLLQKRTDSPIFCFRFLEEMIMRCKDLQMQYDD